MTRKEAIEFLKNMIDRESIGFVCPKGDGDVAVWEYHVTALNMAIKALEQPERKVGMWRITGKEVGAMGIEYPEKTCTSCGWVHSLPIPENYCPRCGSRNT